MSFKLLISSEDVKDLITNYMTKKNIMYEIFSHNNNNEYVYSTITMINGKIDLHTEKNIISKWKIAIYCYNLVTIAKFCAENALTVKFTYLYNCLNSLLAVKHFEDISYLHKHNFVSDNEIRFCLQYVCEKTDNIKALNYLLDFGIKVENFGSLITSIYRISFDKEIEKHFDKQAQMAKSLLNYCRKEYSRRAKKNKYNNELEQCAPVIISTGDCELVELLIKNGFDSSMDKKFVINAFSAGYIDICNLLVSNGFSFFFEDCVVDHIVHGGKMINEKVDFIYKYYIHKNDINSKSLEHKWIWENIKYVDNQYLLRKNKMTGADFLTIVFNKCLTSASFSKKMNVVKAIIGIELDFNPSVKKLVNNSEVKKDIRLYFESVLKNNNTN